VTRNTVDNRAPAKPGRAIDLVAEQRRDGTGVLSLEVHEYFVTVARKLNVDWPLARRQVEILMEFDVVVLEVADILAAMDLHRLHAFSFGMLWFCDRRSKLAVASYGPRIFRKAVKSMGFSS
jgi:hypothetical protein